MERIEGTMTNEQEWVWEALQRVVDRGETRDRIEVAIIIALQHLKEQVEEIKESLHNGTFGNYIPDK
jgi:hypothetical protein